METMTFHSKYTKDGRILLESNGVLLNFDKSICADSPELITSDEYYERFVKTNQSNKFYNLSTHENAALDMANDKLIHGL